ncbi:MAG: hypothetical protein ACTS27_09610 [Phycisphaerales bacterium]
MHASALPTIVGAAALLTASANAQVFSAVGSYTSDNPLAFMNWANAALTGGGVGLASETFDEFNGGPNIDITPGTTLFTANGIGLFFDESPDAAGASRLGIDASSTGWTGDPPFEGSAAVEGFAISPAPGGVGSNVIEIIFPEAVIGFAMDFDSATSGGDLTIMVNDQVLSIEAALPGGADGFFGYVGDEAFTSIRLGAENADFAGEVFDMDNLQWSVVPAPSAAAALGLGGLVALRRRR